MCTEPLSQSEGSSIAIAEEALRGLTSPGCARVPRTLRWSARPTSIIPLSGPVKDAETAWLRSPEPTTLAVIAAALLLVRSAGFEFPV
jgi:hypothetical protein